MNNITDEQRRKALIWINGKIGCSQNWLRDSPENDPGNLMIENQLRMYRNIRTALDPKTVTMEWVDDVVESVMVYITFSLEGFRFLEDNFRENFVSSLEEQGIEVEEGK